ncbi:MAG: carbohydrate kinase family protein [Acidobacteria bacterium]|nr:carbohydrate kinase family protein [Acidobacteriota bacterium]
MGKSFDAVVAGHICLDIIPTVFHPHIEFTPGRLVEVGPAAFSTGGAVSNTGLALGRLGMRVGLMGKVGKDPFGSAILEIIARHDPALRSGMRVAEDEATSYTVIISTPTQDRMFLHCPGCNDTFNAGDVDYSLLGGTRLFHFGYPPLMKRMIEADGTELIAMLRRARETGTTVSLDMCLPDPNTPSGRVDWPKILAASLPHVDIFLPSLDETLFMLYPERRQEIATIDPVSTPALLAEISDRLLKMGPAVVGLKMGSLGLYLRTGHAGLWRGRGRGFPTELEAWTQRELWSPCFRTNVIGTTGSGDATIAGFLAAFLRGLGPEECITVACAVGACNVEAADALGGLRSWEETLARLQAGWARVDLGLRGKGWTRHPDSGVWFGPLDRNRQEDSVA